MQSPLVAIGRIIAPHGLKGTVKVEPMTDFPERYHQTDAVWIAGNGILEKLHVDQVRVQGRFLLVDFQELQTIEAAERLRGCFIQVEPDNLVPLPEGHYYLFQLIGLQVYTLEGEHLGELVEVLQTSANDVYRVSRPERKDILLPALKQVIKEIDLQGGKVTVDPMPGLLDL